MKKVIAISLVLVSSMAVATSAFAMMSDSDVMMQSGSGTMMKDDSGMMKKDTMMKDEAMMPSGSGAMMKDAMMKPKTVAQLAKSKGYTWGKDRAKLAKMAGIKNYRGTASQNNMIKKYLMKESTMMKDTMTK